MDEELEANPAPGDEVTPALQEAAEPDTGAEVETDGETEGDEDDDLAKLAAGEPGDAGPVEIEYDGKKFTVDPALKDAFLRHQDYTKKTMEIAEKGRAIEAVKAQLEEVANVSEERLGTFAKAQALKMQLAALEETVIEGLPQDKVNALELDHIRLTRAIAEVENHGKELANRERAARDQLTAKARETAFTEAAKKIPNLESRRAQISEFLASMGEDPDGVIQTIDNPAVWQVLHYADIGQRFIERQRKAQNIKASQGVNPAEVIGGKRAGAVKDPNKMSPEEYHKMRLKQRAGT